MTNKNVIFSNLSLFSQFEIVTSKLEDKVTKTKLESNQQTREQSYEEEAKLERNKQTREQSYGETELESSEQSREQSHRETKLEKNELTREQSQSSK